MSDIEADGQAAMLNAVKAVTELLASNPLLSTKDHFTVCLYAAGNILARHIPGDVDPSQLLNATPNIVRLAMQAAMANPSNEDYMRAKALAAMPTDGAKN